MFMQLIYKLEAENHVLDLAKRTLERSSWRVYGQKLRHASK